MTKKMKLNKSIVTLFAAAAIAIMGLSLVASSQASAANGADIKIKNETASTLDHSSTYTDYGKWSNFPGSLNAHSSQTFSIQGATFSGVEGTINYTLGQTNLPMKIYFDNSVWQQRGFASCTVQQFNCSVNFSRDKESVGHNLTVNVTLRN